jgi:hypothetical protein
MSLQIGRFVRAGRIWGAVAVLAMGFFTLASAKKDKVPPIDPTAYDALVSNRVTSVAHLLNWFAEQQDHFERLIPPGLDVLNQPGTPDVLVIDLDSKDLPPEFAKHLLGTTPVFRYSVPTYDVFVQETAEGTIEVRDSDGNVLYADPAPSGYAIPYEALYRQSQYPHHYIPELARYRLNARVTLLPLAYVEHYLFAKQQIEEAASLFEEEEPPLMPALRSLGEGGMMMSGSGDDVWISAMTRMTNGLRLSLDYTESYSGQVWSAYSYDARYCPITNSVGGSGGGSPPVPGTNDPPACTNCPINDCEIDATNSFLGLERVWSLAYSNLLLTGATRTVWLDTRPMGLDAQTNPTHRFYGFGSNVDTDNDGLNDGNELFISHTDRENADTDGDGLPDGWEVQNGLNPNNASDASLLLPNTAVNYLTAYQLGLNVTGQYTVVTLGPSDVQIAYKARRATRAKFTGFPAFIQPTNGPPVYYLEATHDEAWTLTEYITYPQYGGDLYGFGDGVTNEYEWVVLSSNMTYAGTSNSASCDILVDFETEWEPYGEYRVDFTWNHTNGTEIASAWESLPPPEIISSVTVDACRAIGYSPGWIASNYTDTLPAWVNNMPDPGAPLSNSMYASVTITSNRYYWTMGWALQSSNGSGGDFYTDQYDASAEWEAQVPYTRGLLETNTSTDLSGLAGSHPWAGIPWDQRVVRSVGEMVCATPGVGTNTLDGYHAVRVLTADEVTNELQEVVYRFAKATQSNVIYRLQWLERFESSMTNGAGQVEEVHTVHFVGNGATQYVGDPTWDAASNQTAYATLATNNAAPDFLLEVPLAERGNGESRVSVIKIDSVEVAKPWSAEWGTLPWGSVILHGNDLRIKVNMATGPLEMGLAAGIWTAVVYKLEIDENGLTNVISTHVVPITLTNAVLHSNTQARITVSATNLISWGLLSKAEDSGTNEFCSADSSNQSSAPTGNSNRNDSDKFDQDQLDAGGIMRGLARAPGSIGAQLPEGDMSHTFIQAAGTRLFYVEVGGVCSPIRQIQEQSDIFYYSGHGIHNGGYLTVVEPLESGWGDQLFATNVTEYWSDVDIAIIAGCSVLDIGDYNGNFSPNYNPGKQWADTGATWYLGYNAWAPSDSRNGNQNTTANIVAGWWSNLVAGASVADSWKNANYAATDPGGYIHGRNACTIYVPSAGDKVYCYFDEDLFGGLTWTCVNEPDWP